MNKTDFEIIPFGETHEEILLHNIGTLDPVIDYVINSNKNAVISTTFFNTDKRIDRPYNTHLLEVSPGQFSDTETLREAIWDVLIPETPDEKAARIQREQKASEAEILRLQPLRNTLDSITPENSVDFAEWVIQFFERNPNGEGSLESFKLIWDAKIKLLSSGFTGVEDISTVPGEGVTINELSIFILSLWIKGEPFRMQRFRTIFDDTKGNSKTD